MKKIKILVGRHYDFSSANNTSLILDNIIPILKLHFEIEIIWFYYMPERIQKKPESEKVIDIHDFKNAYEVIKKTKPDLIIDNEFPSVIDLALDIAAKKCDVPVITRVLSTDKEKTSLKQFLTSFAPLFFQSSLPADRNQKKQFMRRGRFFTYKYLFFLKTLRAIGFNYLKILEYFLITLKWHIINEIPYLNPRFQNTLQFLENENILNEMIQKGYDKASLVVVGNPIFDKYFHKKEKNSIEKRQDNKIRILFAPIQLYEAGIWTKKQRDFIIKKIIANLSKKRFSLIVKLHPTSQRMEEYSKIIHEIDSTIKVYQKGSLGDFLDQVDVVVSFGTIYSSLLPVLISNKPLILCNFLNYNPVTPIDHSVAYECKDSLQLSKTIHLALENKLKNKKNVEEYIKKILFSVDGKASERLANEIILLIKSKKF